MLSLFVLRLTEEVSEGGVVDAERVGEVDGTFDVELIPAAGGLHHRREVAETIDGNDRGFVESVSTQWA